MRAQAAAWRTAARSEAQPAVEPNTAGRWTIPFLLVHVPLALLMHGASTQPVATVHALVILGLGARFALNGQLDRVTAVVAYIAGAEVLWRMTGAQIYWEFGKYAAVAIMFLALLRSGQLRPPALPIAYFALLLPSTVFPLTNRTFAAAIDQLSFNLSGPLALMVSAWFFSKAHLSMQDLRTLFIAAIGPVLGVATVAAAGMFSGSDIVFSTSSNYATSGGFGPNQVSGILGLGAMLAFFMAADGATSRIVRGAMAVLLVALAAQSALTFSRAGLYMAGGGAAVAIGFAAADAQLRSRIIPFVAAVLLVGNYFVVPYLNAFTGGEMAIRFEDTDLTGRDRLIQADISLWKANPIFGVGPGEGRLTRGIFLFGEGGAMSTTVQRRSIAAHTELSRLLAEHGTFGLGALLLLIVGAVISVRRASDARSRAVVAGLICWSTLFMLSNAMRILAPSLAFGLGFATFLVESPVGTREDQTRQPGRGPGQLRPLVAGHPSLKNQSRVPALP